MFILLFLLLNVLKGFVIKVLYKNFAKWEINNRKLGIVFCHCKKLNVIVIMEFKFLSFFNYL